MTLTRLVPTLLVLLAACGGTNGAASRTEPVERIATYTSDSTGFDTHSYWYDTGREVVVFDAQFTTSAAEALLAEIRRVTSSPIKYVVITHPNPDKFNGTHVFRAAGARIVASEATARAIPGVHAYKRAFFVDIAHMIPAASYPPEAAVDVTFVGTLRLELDRGDVELRELAHSGVSSTQTVAWIPAARALIVGDLVHHEAHAWLEGGIVDGAPRPNVDAWIAALEELRSFEGATVYGGRGDVAPVNVAVDAQQTYLRRAREIVAAYVDELGPRRAELTGGTAAAHHAAIRARFEAAFPTHSLAYLVEYGVYGLARQVATNR